MSLPFCKPLGATQRLGAIGRRGAASRKSSGAMSILKNNRNLVTHQLINKADAITKKNIFQKRQVVIPGRSH
jgi:hypothetical protein